MKEKLNNEDQRNSENEWPKFLDNFSRKHEGWSVTLEIFGAELGAQVQERELAFEGIVDEWDEIHGIKLSSCSERSQTTTSHIVLGIRLR